MSAAPSASTTSRPNPHSADPSAESFRARYARQMEDLRQRLHLPTPDQIYSPDESRLTQRPRLFFGDRSVAELKQRVADPRYLQIVQRVHAIAARFAGSTPPREVDLTAHEPNRPFADALPWMAMSALIATDAGTREHALSGLRRWIAAHQAWGPFQINLSLAQSIIALSLVHDWLYDVWGAEERAQLRTMMVERVRVGLDEKRGGLTMWRGQRFGANHNWAHHSARAFAALSLWNEADPSVSPAELKAWLDDALVDFWIVKHTHADDGSPLEGACYQDYGLRFYVDFIVQAESLLKLHESFFEENLRQLWVRLFVLLPGGRGSMVYSDGFADQWWDSSSHFERLASHFRDPRLQLMGEVMRTCGDPRALPSWRSLFHYDPELKPARLEDIPLHGDLPDFGVYAARSDWTADAAFFGLRCGPVCAAGAARRFGHEFGEAHLYPNAGDFTFQIWSSAVVPGCDYAKTKLTRNHNLVLFDGRSRQAGRAVGQLGEGGAWFNSAGVTDPDSDYDHRQRSARVTHLVHGSGFHHYLCDLGGVYRLSDERMPDGVLFPDYWRSLHFFPEGGLAIVDRIRVPVARTCTFRLLTAVENLIVGENGFHFTVWGTPCRIEDYSPRPWIRSVHSEELPASGNQQRSVASLRAEHVREAVFAVLIGVGPAADRYRLAFDDQGYGVTTQGGATLHRVNWTTH